ncbi:site-2 protease family protein [Paenactinomyces guangxiensis]|uniref:Site-2 protease family protein n=1 Tax=Paenactinomyces guangxiensis TaxID=1490290 RepID=A0A7W1WS77_9BACL|nr:site-2 protease family protein [Paenactinomyces guangxiensis]MBA4494891.1 site-2 protease family protein [Paenactinomyces guangxiensis]MBH8591974.1 site-2 protease family protein [Paenactinomyces guangxiensis]
MELPFLRYSLAEIPYVLFALSLAFAVHEFAHAYVAYRFGDPTAKNQGRLSLNPLVHLDVIGTIMIFLAGFGWAKPVPVNRFYFRQPRLAGVLVSVAGPVSNLVLAFIFMFLWIMVSKLGWVSGLSIADPGIANQLFQHVIMLNIVLFIFNLLPFPPLDGYRIIQDLVPNETRAKMTQYETYGIILFLVLAVTPLGDYVFDPIFNTAIPFILSTMSMILSPLL